MADYEEYFQSLERNIVSPLNRTQVEEILERNGWSYQVDNEGDIAGMWGNGIYHFEVTGNRDSVLCVRDTRRGKLELDGFMLVGSLCNRWNTEYHRPKACTRVTDNHELFAYTELPISHHVGLIDSQLDGHLRHVLESPENFFEKLGEEFSQFNEGIPDKKA